MTRLSPKLEIFCCQLLHGGLEALKLFAIVFVRSGLNNYGNTFCGGEENASVLCYFDPDIESWAAARGKK